jgi:hypothetical protein
MSPLRRALPGIIAYLMSLPLFIDRVFSLMGNNRIIWVLHQSCPWMRILHVNNQASVGYLLSRAQRRLGHRSDLLAVPDPKQRAPDISAGSVSGLFIKLLAKAPSYDILHVHGGIGISGLGLWPYKLTGKRFFCHYHGSELREDKQTLMHSMAERLFISTPDLRRYSRNVGGRDLVHIPNPVFMEGVVPVDWSLRSKELEGDGPLRVAHLPSIRRVKGTDNVEKGVKEARDRGARLELDIIEGVTLDDAMRRLSDAHICIDWMSWDYNIHGVVSVESMVRGIPVVCNVDRTLYPEGLPIIPSNPADLGKVLLRLWDERSTLPSVGERSLKYALEHHDPDKVALLMEKYI